MAISVIIETDDICEGFGPPAVKFIKPRTSIIVKKVFYRVSKSPSWKTFFISGLMFKIAYFSAAPEPKITLFATIDNNCQWSYTSNRSTQ